MARADDRPGRSVATEDLKRIAKRLKSLRYACIELKVWGSFVQTNICPGVELKIGGDGPERRQIKGILGGCAGVGIDLAPEFNLACHIFGNRTRQVKQILIIR